jgi:uncharacterized protein
MRRYSEQFIERVPERLRTIFRLAMDRFQLGEMSLHGPSHWLRVFGHAVSLAEQTAGADAEICELFALLHDCERWNEGTDSEHGPRAAAYVRELYREGLLPIAEQKLATLCEACTHHASGRISSDPTIGVCWDADRLDLPRVGARVERRYLSTEAAKKAWWLS